MAFRAREYRGTRDEHPRQAYGGSLWPGDYGGASGGRGPLLLTLGWLP